MGKIRKYITIAVVMIIAISGSISYISKGNVDIQSVSGKADAVEISKETETVKSQVNGSGDEGSGNVSDTAESESKDLSGKVDINSASLEELQIAPGIGPSKAQSIIDYRNEYGSFSCVEELIEVSGIGEKTLAKIKDYYCAK